MANTRAKPAASGVTTQNDVQKSVPYIRAAMRKSEGIDIANSASHAARIAANSTIQCIAPIARIRSDTIAVFLESILAF
jgi:hypothetical protein